MHVVPAISQIICLVFVNWSCHCTEASPNQSSHLVALCIFHSTSGVNINKLAGWLIHMWSPGKRSLRLDDFWWHKTQLTSNCNDYTTTFCYRKLTVFLLFNHIPGRKRICRRKCCYIVWMSIQGKVPVYERSLKQNKTKKYFFLLK